MSVITPYEVAHEPQFHITLGVFDITEVSDILTNHLEFINTYNSSAYLKSIYNNGSIKITLWKLPSSNRQYINSIGTGFHLIVMPVPAKEFIKLYRSIINRKVKVEIPASFNLVQDGAYFSITNSGFTTLRVVSRACIDVLDSDSPNLP